MNIMLIDDDKVSLMLLAKLIGRLGHRCYTFTSPQQAVEKYEQNNYDLVVSDLKMPGMDGIEVLQTIKTIHQESVVIIVSGEGDEGTANQVIKLGACAFFQKPIDPRALLEKIGQIAVDKR